MIGKENVRIMPMVNPLPLWDKGSVSEYPETLRMAFRDGKIRNYRLVVEETVQQPTPQVVSASELTRMFEENTFGGYKPRHGKK